jgi:hypothetical protein
VVYEGAGHGICSTQKDRVNQELLAFFREPVTARQEQELSATGAGR